MISVENLSDIDLSTLTVEEVKALATEGTLTPAQMAERWRHLNKSAVARAARDGRLPHLRHGSRGRGGVTGDAFGAIVIPTPIAEAWVQQGLRGIEVTSTVETGDAA